jgi:biopolymer transport protein ExbD
MKEKREKISIREKIIISKFRFWGGLTITILLSYVLYLFFIISRDFLRLLTFSDNFNYLEFSSNELVFYNLYFAFLSLIIGQNYFFKIIFDTNKKLTEKRIQFKRKKIVHDQNVLIWFFLFWFVKLASFYGVMNMSGFGQNVNYAPTIHEHINFFEEFPCLFVLIILVLFFQSWQSLGLTIRHYFKYLILSFILISVLAIGFTKLNLVDFEQYFKKQHAENPYIKENIQLPKVHFTESLSLRHKEKEFFITKDLKIIYNNQELDTIAFKKKLAEIRDGYSYGNFQPFIQLNVSENITMKKLYKLKKLIYSNTNYEIAFAAYPKEVKLKKVIFQDHPVGLFEDRRFVYPFHENITSSSHKYKNAITLRLTNENEILVNNNSIPCNEIANTIAKEIAKKEYYTITIKLKENALLSDYMQVLSYAREGYLKACQIIGKEKGIDDFTLEYFPNQIINFNTIDIDEPIIMGEPIDIDDLFIPIILEDE